MGGLSPASNFAVTQPLLPRPYAVGEANGSSSAPADDCLSLQEMLSGSPSRLK